jgi:hypothetical protein
LRRGRQEVARGSHAGRKQPQQSQAPTTELTNGPASPREAENSGRRRARAGAGYFHGKRPSRMEGHGAVMIRHPNTVRRSRRRRIPPWRSVLLGLLRVDSFLACRGATAAVAISPKEGATCKQS